MSIISNIVNQDGDILTIKTENPAVGLTSLTGYTDTTTGETGSNYFIKTFRYSLNGIIWSDELPLTNPNIIAIPVTKYNELTFEYYYKKTGDNSTPLTVSSVEVDGVYVSLPEGQYYKDSSFAKYFDAYDTEVLNWYLNTSEKIFYQDILARFISRYNDAGSPDDFILYFKSVAKFFALYVILARKISRFYTDRDNVVEFLVGRGIITGDNTTYYDVYYLMNTYLHQMHNRGTIHIIDKKVPDRQYTTPSTVNGEFLRSFDYEDRDENLFNLYKTEHFGWNLSNSSPLYKGLSKNENFNKIYETNSKITDLSRWPHSGTIVIQDVNGVNNFKITNSGSVGNIVTLNVIKVDPRLDYELDFFVKKPNGNNFSVGIDGYDINNTISLPKNAKNSTPLSYFFQTINFRSDTYIHIKCFIFNSSKPNDINSIPNIGVGNNLILNPNCVSIVPKIVFNGTGDCYIQNITLLPLKTNYSRGFLQTHNFISSIIKDNRSKYGYVSGENINQYTTQQQLSFKIKPIKDLEDYTSKFLIPYNSTIKITNIGDVLLTDSLTVLTHTADTFSYIGSGLSCSFSESPHNTYIGTSSYSTLIQINNRTKVPTGVSKSNTSSDPDYIASSLNPTVCHTYSVTWIGDEDTYECLKVSGDNTGYKNYITLLEKRLDTGVLTGNTKSNTSGDPDYIAPILNTTECPLPTPPPVTNVDPFSFTALTGQALSNYIVSNTDTLSGNNVPVPISVVGGEFSINGGGFSSVTTTINPSDTFRVRVLSSSLNSTETHCTLTISDQSAIFSVTTLTSTPGLITYTVTIDASTSALPGGDATISVYDDTTGALKKVISTPNPTTTIIPFFKVIDNSDTIHLVIEQSSGTTQTTTYTITGIGSYTNVTTCAPGETKTVSSIPKGNINIVMTDSA